MQCNYGQKVQHFDPQLRPCLVPPSMQKKGNNESSVALHHDEGQKG
jgi:hypothetical protein